MVIPCKRRVTPRRARQCVSHIIFLCFSRVLPQIVRCCVARLVHGTTMNFGETPCIEAICGKTRLMWDYEIGSSRSTAISRVTAATQAPSTRRAIGAKRPSRVRISRPQALAIAAASPTPAAALHARGSSWEARPAASPAAQASMSAGTRDNARPATAATLTPNKDAAHHSMDPRTDSAPSTP
jgi:hypothetical protein